MSIPDLNLKLILDFVDRATGPARKAMAGLNAVGAKGVETSNRYLATVEASQAALRGQAVETGVMAAALYKALQPSIAFEKSLAGVSKVLDFDTPDGFAAIQRDILALTSADGLPMVAEGIAEIIEAAGQAGVVDAALPDDEERRQLIAFAREAAQMGVAFDISAEQSGTAMAQWRKAMGLSQTEAVQLGDAINHLSNKMNATAPALVDIIRRQGAVAQTAGLAETEIAALSAAFLSGGASPEIAATGMKNFLSALTKGEAVTKRQSEVMSQLGVDALELSKRMQVDAKGAIVEVMEALSELPAHAQGAALSQLFGEESKGAIAPLLTNIDLLREAFELVAEPSQFAGSMLEEYQKQAATTANALQITQNYTRALAIVTGTVLLPALNDLLGTIQPLVAQAIEWAQANPELIETIAQVVAGLLAFKVVSIALKWSVLAVVAPILKLVRAFSWALRLAAPLAGAFTALGATVVAVLRSIAVAVAANPIGLFLTMLAGGAWLIYDNWDDIDVYFEAKLGRVSKAFEDNLGEGLKATFKEFNPVTLFIDANDGLLKKYLGLDVGKEVSALHAQLKENSAIYRLGVDMANALLEGFWAALTFDFQRFKSAFDPLTTVDLSGGGADLIASMKSGIDTGLAALIQSIKDTFASINLFEQGMAIIQTLWDGMAALVTDMVNAISAKISGIVPPWLRNQLSAGDETTPPGRDAGGPVRAGMMYEVGERGREWFVPNVSGSILPNRTVRAALAMATASTPALGADLGGLSSYVDQAQSEIVQSLDRRPALSAVQGAQTIRQGDTIHVHINAGSGADPRAIASEVERVLRRREDARRGDLHDGSDF